MKTTKWLTIIILGLVLILSSSIPVLAGKDHLTIALQNVPAGVDFYASTSRAVLQISYMIFDPLLEREPKTGELKPHLVTSWKIIDDLTWEFKLRPGVTFHNGNPLNAESVRFTIMDYLLNPEIKSPHAGAFKWCKDVQVIDDLTFRVITEKPYPLVTQRFNVLFPYDPAWTKEMMAKHGAAYLARHAMGTGPFKFIKFVEGEKIELVRNDNYWKKGVPEFAKMTFRFIIESSTRMAELMSGGVDVNVAVTPDQRPLIKKDKNLALIYSPLLRVIFMQLDSQLNAPKTPKAIKDVRVRRAINYAIDRETIRKAIFGGFGANCYLPINPVSFGADPTIASPKYDPEKAKTLMKEAGYEKGFDLTIWTPFSMWKKLAEAAMPYFEAINIKLKIRDYSGRWGEFVKLFKAKKTDGIVLMSWGSYNIFDADAIWSYFFMTPEGPFNYNQNEELNDLLHQARETLDQAKRKELYKKAQKIIVDQAYWTPLYTSYVVHGTNSHLHYVLGFDQVPRWQYGTWK